MAHFRIERAYNNLILGYPMAACLKPVSNQRSILTYELSRGAKPLLIGAALVAIALIAIAIASYSSDLLHISGKVYLLIPGSSVGGLILLGTIVGAIVYTKKVFTFTTQETLHNSDVLHYIDQMLPGVSPATIVLNHHNEVMFKVPLNNLYFDNVGRGGQEKTTLNGKKVKVILEENRQKNSAMKAPAEHLSLDERNSIVSCLLKEIYLKLPNDISRETKIALVENITKAMIQTSPIRLRQLIVDKQQELFPNNNYILGDSSFQVIILIKDGLIFVEIKVNGDFKNLEMSINNPVTAFSAKGSLKFSFSKENVVTVDTVIKIEKKLV